MKNKYKININIRQTLFLVTGKLVNIYVHTGRRIVYDIEKV